ncbi:hypothetical protein G6016_00600 [Dietzia aerolata]|uniref:Uncharacterized protein n=1 Tax=Dietzia aerolata TaxID=595984 RepID=A0ABV5JTI8_9ACTN|nr:hypothetical protein [Dietzia aerolata]MBB0967482.1 hypothetical protein [Dietzia aerolata]
MRSVSSVSCSHVRVKLVENVYRGDVLRHRRIEQKKAAGLLHNLDLALNNNGLGDCLRDDLGRRRNNERLRGSLDSRGNILDRHRDGRRRPCGRHLR